MGTWGRVTLVILLFVAAPMLVGAQTRKPWSVGDLEDLLKGKVTPKRITALIEKHGVNFTLTTEIRERLRRAGADESVLRAVEQAALLVYKRLADMVEVQAGDFFMGCNEKVDNNCYGDEKPGKMVNLPTFSIDKTEVTVAAYRQCVGARKCSEDGLAEYDSCNWKKTGRENHPLNCVDWHQAKAYCEWAGKRLPMEAEWEKAARGTDGRIYPWGNEWDVKKVNGEGTEDGFAQTAPVGSFSAGRSPYEALDMTGNVWEWTANWYDNKQTLRSMRGGSWLNGAWLLRVSYRLWDVPGDRSGGVGFRCAE